MRKALCVVLVSVLGAPGCADFMAEIAANQAAKVLVKAARSFETEPDPWLAYHGGLSQLKFAEGALEASPENEDLLVLVARNYTQFAFAFLQDEAETAPEAERETARQRAMEFHKRARAFISRRMSLDIEDFDRALMSAGDRFDQILTLLDPEEHVAPMYWLGFAWWNLIALGDDDPVLVADLPRVHAIMKWVHSVAPDYDAGGAETYFALSELRLARQEGASLEAAKARFDAAVAATQGKALMVKALYARYYCRAAGDREAYLRLLQDVQDAPADALPERRLMNALAKQRAVRWSAEVDKYFE